MSRHLSERQFKNAQRAYELLEEIDPLSMDDLLRVHSLMMTGLTDDAGCFRSRNVGVFDGEELIHPGTPANYVAEMMGELFRWMSSTNLHPLLVSCIFHYEFEFIHPFSDGNGRTGRLWQTLILSRWRSSLAWLPIETIIRSRQQEYYTAFARSNELGTSTVFVEFMLEVIRDALIPYTDKGVATDYRQQRVLDYFLKNPKGTVDGLAELLATSKRTAERLVYELKAQGRLIREGTARAGVWKVARR